MISNHDFLIIILFYFLIHPRFETSMRMDLVKMLPTNVLHFLNTLVSTQIIILIFFKDTHNFYSNMILM